MKDAGRTGVGGEVRSRKGSFIIRAPETQHADWGVERSEHCVCEPLPPLTVLIRVSVHQEEVPQGSVAGGRRIRSRSEEVLIGCHGDSSPRTILLSMRGHCLGVWRRNAEQKTLMFGVLLSQKRSDAAVIAGRKGL
ncbi:unnamed protein product [Leuciscus chuanchicus]